MAAAENKAILQRYAEEIWNKGNLAVIDEVITPNVSPLVANAPVSQFVAMRVSRPYLRGTEGKQREDARQSCHWPEKEVSSDSQKI